MSKDKGKRHGKGNHTGDGGHGQGREASRPAEAGPPLPGTRAELLALHAETRRRRNAAELGSADHRAAVELIGRIEVEIARIERAMDPPLV
jgi:hypothetical protein